MSSEAKPPEPCLIAIILIVRSRAGPRFVFHYPPNPYNDRSLPYTRTKSSRARSNDSGSSSGGKSSSTSEDGEDDLENLINSAQTITNTIGSPINIGATNSSSTAGAGGAQPSNNNNNNTNFDDDASIVGAIGEATSHRPPSLNSARGNKRRTATTTGSLELEDGSDLHDAIRRDKDPRARPLPWDSILGLPPVVWEKLLSPTRTWHKRRFELGINDFAFVGWPVFIRDDGTWRKQKRKKTKKNTTPWATGELGHEDHRGEDSGDALEIARQEGGHEPAERSDTTTDGPSDTKPGRKLIDAVDQDKDSMDMFNVVFVLDPPLLEYSQRLKEMYDNTIKKFGKALKWEQARTDYVWREAQKILQMKERARGRS